MKKTLSLTLALAAASLTIGSAAIAQDRPQHGTEITRADAETRAATAFARMDANGDGLLNAADRDARAQERFARVDADGNGQVSFEEMQAARETRREAMQERRANRAEAGERRGRRGGERMGRRGGGRMHGQRGPGFAALMRQNADTDGDGAISQAEFTSNALVRFDRADADHDGTVTRQERRAHREAMRPVREAHRRQNAE